MKNFAQISEALKYIDAHLDEPITLEALAEKFYLSPFYFHKVFSSIVGKPLAAYIRDRRVLYAGRQLCTTDKTILDIALDCGFQSPQSFGGRSGGRRGSRPARTGRGGVSRTSSARTS